ncbi:MAG: ABC transporter permease [Micromonosporaceae bacterium]
MAETAVTEPDSALPLRELAARHGLSVAGERPTLPRYVRQLWSYRHFILSYANAKLVASFSTARLGQLWQVLTPLSNAAVYYLIFGLIIGGSREVNNFIGYLCTGLFIFIFTSTVVQGGTSSITGNLGLIRALHFPRAALPIAIMLTQFQSLIAAVVVLMGIMLATGEPLTVEWLLVLPALLLQAIFNVGLAMAMARLGAKLTDLKQVMPFVLRTWMYGSAVLYSVDRFEHLPDNLELVVESNPLLIYIELVRLSLMENVPLGNSPTRLWLLGVAWAVLFGVVGFLYFWRGEQEYGRG